MKENDLVFNMVFNPQMSIAELNTIGLNSSNTTVKDFNAYANDPTIQKAVVDADGVFDLTKLKLIHNLASKAYMDMANKDYNKDSLVLFSKYNIFAEPEEIDYTPSYTFTRETNPLQVRRGVFELGKTGDPVKTIDEIALSLKVLANPVEVSKGATPIYEDAPDAGIFSQQFWKNFLKTRVLALWDEDGTHQDPATGRLVLHSKGDPKLNDEGYYYYEDLDGRNIYGRRVLNKFNTLTPEDSKWNTYDFFDSDDKESKSPVGIVAKNLALVGSMFLPYVGPVVAATSAGINILDLSAKLGKMLTSSDSPTLSAIEGWAKSVNRQGLRTEYATLHTWSFENILDSIGDLTGLLREQRAIFNFIPGAFTGKGYRYVSIKKGFDLDKAAAGFFEDAVNSLKLSPKWAKIYNAPGSQALGMQAFINSQELTRNALYYAELALDSYLKKYNNLGAILSKTYMAGLISSNLYEEAKALGISDSDAAWLTLGRFAAEMTLLNTPVGNAIFPELRAERIMNKKILQGLTPTEYINKLKQISELSKNRVANNVTKEELVSWIKLLIQKGSKLKLDSLPDKAASVATAGTLRQALPGAMASGLEIGVVNDIEAFLDDLAKQIHLGVVELRGLDTKTFEGESRAWHNMLDRYGMGMVSGLVGGTITSAFSLYGSFKGIKELNTKEALQQVIYKYRNGQLDDFYKLIDKTEFANPKLSSEMYLDENGNYLFKPGTETNNLNLEIKRVIKNNIDNIVSIARSKGISMSDNSFIDLAVLPEMKLALLRDTLAIGRIINDYNTLGAEIVSTVLELNRGTESINGDVELREAKKELANENSVQALDRKETEARLKFLEDKFDALRKGEHTPEYMSAALLETMDSVSRYLGFPSTAPLFAHIRDGVNWDSLSDNKKMQYILEWKVWRESNVDKLFIYADTFKYLLDKLSPFVSTNHLAYLNDLNNESYKSLLSRAQSLYSIFLNIENINSLSANVKDALYTEALAQEDLVDTRTMRELSRQYPEFELAYLSFNNKFHNITIDPTLTLLGKTLLLKQAAEEFDTFYSNFVKNKLIEISTPLLNLNFINGELKSLIVNSLQKAKDWIRANKLAPIGDFDGYNNEGKQLWYINEIAVDNMENSASNADQIEEEFNLNVEFVNTVEDYIKQFNDKLNTPVEQVINEVSLQSKGAPLRFTLLLDTLNQVLADSHDDLQAFTATVDMMEAVKNAQEVLSLAAASIQAMRTDNGNLNNLFGYAATLNEVGRKYRGKDWLDIAEIDTLYADAMILDIAILKNKLDFFSNLYALNSGQKFIKHNKIELNAAKQNFKMLLTFLGSAPGIGDDIKLSLLEAMKDMEMHRQLLESDSLSLTHDLDVQLNIEKVRLGQLIRKHFSNMDVLQLKEALFGELLSPDFGKNTESLWLTFIRGRQNTLLNETMKTPDLGSFLNWFIGEASINSPAFYNEFSSVLDGTKAPVIALEMAIKQTLAFVTNTLFFINYMTAMQLAFMDVLSRPKEDKGRKALEDYVKGRIGDPYDNIPEHKLLDVITSLLNLPRFTNLMGIEGIAGSGKTTICNYVLKLLKKYHPNKAKNVFFVHGADPNSSINLAKECGYPDAKTFGIDSFMKYIMTNYVSRLANGNLAANTETEIKQFKGLTYKNCEIKALEELSVPSLIVIDEIGLFNNLELDAIDRFARRYGIVVIGLGDYDLNVAGGLIRDTETGLSMHTTSIITSMYHPYKQGASLRTYNNVKDHNQASAQAFINLLRSSDPGQALDIDIRYYETDTEFKGDKFELSVADVIKVIDKLMTLKDRDGNYLITEEHKLGFIQSNPDSALSLELKKLSWYNKVEPKLGVSGLGGEGNYYLVEPPKILTQYLNGPKGLEWARYLYTGMTRSHVGSIIFTNAPFRCDPTVTYPIDNSHSPKKVVSIVNTKVDDCIDLPPTSEAIKAYTEKRLLVYDAIKNYDGFAEDLRTGTTENELGKYEADDTKLVEQPLVIQAPGLPDNVDDELNNYRNQLPIGTLLYVPEGLFTINSIQRDASGNIEIKGTLVDYNGASQEITTDYQSLIEASLTKSLFDLKVLEFLTTHPYNFEGGIVYISNKRINTPYEPYTINAIGIDENSLLYFLLTNVDTQRSIYANEDALNNIYDIKLYDATLSDPISKNDIKVGYVLSKSNGETAIIVNVTDDKVVIKLTKDGSLATVDTSKLMLLLQSLGSNPPVYYLSKSGSGFENKDAQNLPKIISDGKLKFNVDYFRSSNSLVNIGAVVTFTNREKTIPVYAYLNRNGKWEVLNAPQFFADILNTNAGDVRYIKNVESIRQVDDATLSSYSNNEQYIIDNLTEYEMDIEDALSKLYQDSLVNDLTVDDFIDYKESLASELLLLYEANIQEVDPVTHIPAENGSKASLKNLWFSHACEETGLDALVFNLYDSLGNYNPAILLMKLDPNNTSSLGVLYLYRIDSINGLLKLRKPNTQLLTIGEYLVHLRNLHQIALSHTNINDITREINNYLESNDFVGKFENSIFSLWTQPTKPANGSTDNSTIRINKSRSNTPSDYLKHALYPSEQINYEDALHEDAVHSLHNKMVLKLMDKDGVSGLVLPVLNWNNPITVMFSVSKFKNTLNVFQLAYKSSNKTNKIEAITEAIDKVLTDLTLRNDPNLQPLLDLFEIYNYTSSDTLDMVTPKADGTYDYFTPMKDLQLEGFLLTKDAGKWVFARHLEYKGGFDRPATWKNISDLARSYTITRLLESKTGRIGDKENAIAKGRLFVLIGPKHFTESLVIDMYRLLIMNPSLPKQIFRAYVLAPAYTIEEFIENLNNRIFKKLHSSLIGNLVTSYKILSKLLKSDLKSNEGKLFLDYFREGFETNKEDNSDSEQTFNSFMNYISQLDAITEQMEQATNSGMYNALSSKRSSILENFVKFDLSKKEAIGTNLLDLFLLKSVYPSVYSGDGTFINTVKRQHVLDLINKILPNYPVFAKPTLVPVTSFGLDTVGNGDFILVKQGYKWDIENRPCLVSSKLDFYAFSGGFLWLSTFADLIRHRYNTVGSVNGVNVSGRQSPVGQAYQIHVLDHDIFALNKKPSWVKLGESPARIKNKTSEEWKEYFLYPGEINNELDIINAATYYIKLLRAQYPNAIHFYDLSFNIKSIIDLDTAFPKKVKNIDLHSFFGVTETTNFSPMTNNYVVNMDVYFEDGTEAEYALTINVDGNTSITKITQDAPQENLTKQDRVNLIVTDFAKTLYNGVSLGDVTVLNVFAEFRDLLIDELKSGKSADELELEISDKLKNILYDLLGYSDVYDFEDALEDDTSFESKIFKLLHDGITGTDSKIISIFEELNNPEARLFGEDYDGTDIDYSADPIKGLFKELIDKALELAEILNEDDEMCNITINIS